MVCHVEIEFSGFPVVAGLGQEGGDQAQEGLFIGEDAGHAGAAFEFLVDAFQRIGGAHPLLVGGGQREHGEPLRQIYLQPGRQFGSGFGVVGAELLELLFGGGATGAVEDVADGPGDLGALLQARDVSLGVLLEVELAALLGDGAKDGLTRGGHAGMIVADDVGDAAQAALQEALEEGPPMHFGLTEGDTHTEDDALACGGDAQGDEDGAVAELAVVADFFIAGVEHQIGTRSQGPVAPFWSSASKSLAQSLTWVELRAVPQSSSTMAETLRVGTLGHTFRPWRV